MKLHRSAFAAFVFALATAAPLAAQFETQKLEPADLQTMDFFGVSVSEANGVLVVGSWQDDDLGGNAGSAYVFERESSGWVETEKLLASDGEGLDWFGFDSSTDGVRAAIGAFGHDNAGLDAGAVYVFRREPGGWVEEAILVDTKDAGASWLGQVVAMRGDVVAAMHEEVSSHWTEVIVYERVGGAWTQAQELVSPNGSNLDGFGRALALHQGVLWVGAPGANRVYGYRGTPSGWQLVVELAPSAGSPASFGASVATDGLRLIVGDPSDDGGRGAAHVFVQVDSVWTFEALLSPYDGPDQGFFGNAVDIEGGRALIGRYYDHDVASQRGSAYEFELVAGTWEFAGKLFPQFPGVVSRFAWDLTLATDEAICGSRLENNRGAAHVIALADVGTEDCYCEDGPCNNPDEFAGCRHGNGKGARLNANGSASVAADDLKLCAAGLPPVGIGLVFMGRDAIQMPFGNGELCVWDPVGPFRFPVRTAVNSVLREGPGILAYASSHFPGAAGNIDPGDTWRFQAWIRDPNGPCGAPYNTTNAVEVQFAP